MLTNILERQAFKKAVFEICGTNWPRRSELKEIGVRAAKIADRAKPWGGAHIYVLLHFEKWPKYTLNKQLYRAVMQMAGMEATNGKRHVDVIADHVREGAVILLKSRKCARRRCKIHFVGLGKFCSMSCRKRTQASQRHRRIEKRRAEKR